VHPSVTHLSESHKQMVKILSNELGYQVVRNGMGPESHLHSQERDSDLKSELPTSLRVREFPPPTLPKTEKSPKLFGEHPSKLFSMTNFERLESELLAITNF